MRSVAAGTMLAALWALPMGKSPMALACDLFVLIGSGWFLYLFVGRNKS
jgi:hypothetical protein